jgi:prevent-host-death family protein
VEPVDKRPPWAKRREPGLDLPISQGSAVEPGVADAAAEPGVEGEAVVVAGEHCLILFRAVARVLTDQCWGGRMRVAAVIQPRSSIMAEVTAAIPDVLSYSALDEPTQQLVDRVRATQCPVVITRDGKAAAVLVEAQEYELHLRKLALMERIMRAKREIAEDRYSTQEEVEKLLDEWSGEGE